MDSPMNPGKSSMWKLYNATNQYLCHQAARTIDARVGNMFWGLQKRNGPKSFVLSNGTRSLNYVKYKSPKTPIRLPAIIIPIVGVLSSKVNTGHEKLRLYRK